MSTFQVNVFVFGETIDHLERQVKVTLSDIDFGEFVSIIGTSAAPASDIRGELEAEVTKLQESITHHEKRIPFLEVEMEAIREEMEEYKRKKESKRDAAHSTLPLIGYFDSEYHHKDMDLKEKLRRVEFHILAVTSLREKLTVAQRERDRYNPTPEQIEGDQKIREEHAVLRRKRLVLEWCTQHGSNYISPDLVSQIIVSFESADQESPPGFLRLID